MEQAYNAKKWGFVPDYARLDVIYEYGGIYIDTDVQAIKSLNPLLENELLLGWEECTIDVVKRKIGTGFIACEKGNWFIGKVLEFYNKEIMSSSMFIIPAIMTHIYDKLSKDEKDKIEILSKDYFSPYDSGGGKRFSKDLITENTYVIHWFSYSWGSFKNRRWVQVKHIKNPIKRRIAMLTNRIKFFKETQIVKRNKKNS